MKLNQHSYIDSFETTLFPLFGVMLETEQTNLLTTAICIVATLIEDCPTHPLVLSKYTSKLFPVCLKHATNADHDLRQSAVFGIGTCAAAMNVKFLPVATQSITTLVNVVQAPDSRSEENEPATVNAISAIGKICRYVGPVFTGQPPLDLNQLLPLWLSWLPGGGDEEEARKVHALLTDFVETGNTALLGQHHVNLPKIISVWATILNNEDLCSPETKNKIITLWATIQRQIGQPAIKQIWSQLESKQQETMKSYTDVSLL